MYVVAGYIIFWESVSTYSVFIPFIFSVPYGQPLVYHPNPYVYIPAIGQVARPVPEAEEVPEVKTIEEKKPVYTTHPLVYTHGSHPLVYTHGLHPIHPVHIAPRGFAYSFTVDHEDIKSE